MNIRPITIDDAKNCGQVIYTAFGSIAEKHNFPHDFPSLESAMQMAQISINNPNVVGFAAETDNGQFIGSNFLWKQNSIVGVGPITVDPAAQAKGVGRRLMEAVIEAGQDAEGIRLVQDAFNTASMSLYTSLGFDVVEPLVILQGTPAEQRSSFRDTVIRPLEDADLAACGDLSQKILGVDRSSELKETAQAFRSFVAERENRIVAYVSAPTFWQLNHAVAETVSDMQEILLVAANLTQEPLAFLLPTRQSELFRWCLAQKLRVVKPMTLMKMGKYKEPLGTFLPSVLY